MSEDELFEKTGVASLLMAAEKFPPSERLKKGRVAVIECYRRIPCNPCETACPSGAIVVGEDINNIPVIDFDRCTGCGLCLSKCPGLAIMLVNASVPGGMIEFSVPHEFLPLPCEGDRVEVVDRNGDTVCDGIVTRVLCPQSFDRTPVVRVLVNEAYLMRARAIRVNMGGLTDGG